MYCWALLNKAFDVVIANILDGYLFPLPDGRGSDGTEQSCMVSHIVFVRKYTNLVICAAILDLRLPCSTNVICVYFVAIFTMKKKAGPKTGLQQALTGKMYP